MINEDTLEALEFQSVLDAVSGFAHGEPSGAAARGLRPLGDLDGIARRSGIVEEIRRLIQSGSPLAFRRFGDISAVLGALRPEGAVLDPLDLVLLKPVLSLAESLAGAVPDGGYPLLSEIASGLGGFPHLLSAIERTVDEEGGILDTASFELGEIRARRRALDRRIGRRLEEMVREPARTVFLQDDFITKRSGRWVIPVRMDAKGQMQGVVHDVSRSGETAFMEPLEIIGLSNELENLVADEKAEEIRILRGISRELRALGAGLKAQYEAVVELDLMNAIALFSERHGLSSPEINTHSEIKLIGARHPILMLGRNAGDVVPLDLELGGENLVMLITGPNAGGKTIVIKTVGLLILMALTGIPVPARPSSSLPLLRGLLVDIGDEQSINENLSTFSAHISNIAAILGEAGPDSVVLLDELGTGTDPSQGGALGCAIIRELMARGSRVLATTHLIDIVGFVHRTEGMVNASMEFDPETHTPLYRLKEGEPGQSHAIEIASRYGLPQNVIGFAREMLGSMQEEFHTLLSDLKHKRALHEAALAEAEESAIKLRQEGRALEERLRSIEQEKKAVMKNAYEEAAAIISAIRREAAGHLEELRRTKKRDAMRRMDAMSKQVKGKLVEFQEGPGLRAEDVREGDMVFVSAIGRDAEVAALDTARGRVRVRAGGKELEVAIEDLAPASGKGPRPKVTYESSLDEQAPTELNIIGQRVDDALAMLEKFIDRASLAGAREVRVVHGIGTGALRKAVREYLSGHPFCKGHRAGEAHEGGDGATVVRMR